MSEQTEAMPMWQKVAIGAVIVAIIVTLVILFYPAAWEAFPVQAPGQYYVQRSYSPSWASQPDGNANGSYLNYQGCYTDKGERSLPHKAPNNMNLDDCYTYALEQGDNYLGLQYWGNGNPQDPSKVLGECWSGSTLPTYGSATNCTPSPNGLTAALDASGQNPYQVGSAWSNAVYQLQTPQ